MLPQVKREFQSSEFKSVSLSAEQRRTRRHPACRTSMLVAAIWCLCIPASIALAATFRESGDSFGNIARPYRAGTYAVGADNTFVGSVFPIGGDQNDVIQFSLSRPATVTITPTTPMELSVTRGSRLQGRNFPQFGSFSMSLPSGTFNLAIAGLSTNRTAYNVRVRVR